MPSKCYASGALDKKHNEDNDFQLRVAEISNGFLIKFRGSHIYKADKNGVADTVDMLLRDCLTDNFEEREW